MARTNHKLSKVVIQEMFYQLCVALSHTKNPREAAELMSDLLSFQESEIIAKRLRIAQLLLAGKRYDDIMRELKVARATITRVNEWLRMSGVGYRRAVGQMKEIKISQRKSSSVNENLFSLKKRYPQYFWPQILLERVVMSASQRQKKKIVSVISQLEKTKEKTALFRRIKKLALQ